MQVRESIEHPFSVGIVSFKLAYEIITMCIECTTMVQAIALTHAHMYNRQSSKVNVCFAIQDSFIISKAKELCFETSTNMKYSTALINSRFSDHLRVWCSNGTKQIGTGSNRSGMGGYFAFTILLTVFLNLPFLWKRKRE